MLKLLGIMVKEIYASLELGEKEVRVLVGEYYNTRFNVLKLAKQPCDGVKNFKIYDSKKVKEAIDKCLLEIRDKLGANIEKVILLIPPYNFKRFPLRVNIAPESGKIKKSDIARAIAHTLEKQIDPDVMVVNRNIIKYSINGISYRRLPEGETCNEVLVDIDLLCADKDMIYSYVQTVEDVGLQIQDICLTNYAVCKEGVLIEQSLNKNIVLIDIGDSSTILSLLSKGKLYNAEILENGLENIIEPLHKVYPLPYETLLRLVKYNASDNTESNDMIYAYTKDEETYNITNKQLNEIIKGPLSKYINDLASLCKTIISSGETLFVLVGEGSDMIYLADKLKIETNADIKIYHPDTLGVRDAELLSLFGSFFAEKEILHIKEEDIECIDLMEFEKVINHMKIDAEGQTLTTKIKKLFEQYVNKEN